MSNFGRDRTNNQSGLRRILRYGPVIAWMAAIFYASSSEFSAANTSQFIGPLFRWLFPDITDETLMVVHAVTRKCAHLGAYAVFAFLATRAFRSSSRRFLSNNWFAWSLTLTSVYALLDEFHQSFVPSRTASILDSGIDVIGALAFLCAYQLYVWQRGDGRAS
jgi:VanZ family protein